MPLRVTLKSGYAEDQQVLRELLSLPFPREYAQLLSAPLPWVSKADSGWGPKDLILTKASSTP